MKKVSAIEALVILSGTTGPVSIEDGVATLPCGSTIDLKEVAKNRPRVLISVSGGVATYNADGGADVAQFDWDDFNAEAKDASGIPERFADLAKDMAIPIEGKPGVTS